MISEPDRTLTAMEGAAANPIILHCFHGDAWLQEVPSSFVTAMSSKSQGLRGYVGGSIALLRDQNTRCCNIMLSQPVEELLILPGD